MILCLTCKRLSHADAIYCGHCKRSFRVKRCAKKGHPSSPTALCCEICGSDNLSEATSCLSFGWLTRLLALLLVFGVWRVIWYYHRPVVQAVWKAPFIGLGFLFGVTPVVVLQTVGVLVVEGVLIYFFIGLVVKGETGKHLQHGFLDMTRGLLRLLAKAVGFVLSAAVTGKKDPHSKTGQRRH